MHVHFLDRYEPRASPVHALDPRVKLTLAVGYILSAALLPPGAWPAYILLLALMLAVELLSDLGVLYVLRRAVVALPFILAAVPVMFTVDGPAIFELSIGSFTLTLTTLGLERFISIALKSWLSVQMAIVLSATTSFPDLMLAMRALKIPRPLVAIFGLMWRYLFVLVDEAMRLLRARQARSGHSDLPGFRPGGSLTWRARVAGGMAGSLFLRAIERSDRIYMAMAARGYDGEVRALGLPRVSPASWTTLVIGLMLLGLVLLIGVIV